MVAWKQDATKKDNDRMISTTIYGGHKDTTDSRLPTITIPSIVNPLMQKTYHLYALEDCERADDRYDNPEADYADQLSLPFLEDFADLVDKSSNLLLNTLCITNSQSREFISHPNPHPRQGTYFDTESEDDELMNYLYSNLQTDMVITVTVVQ